MTNTQEQNPIGATSAYLIPWLERLEMISLKRLSDSIEKKDEAAQQAEIDIVHAAIARLVNATKPTANNEA
ncbi:MAG: hypothetical protein ABI559_08385 [Chloroflexota bacterium]